MTLNYCKTCGGVLEKLDDFTLICPYCKNIYKNEQAEIATKLLNALLDNEKTEKINNLRRNLYDALSEEYTDSEEICRICTEIKKYLPNDFAADFYYKANRGTPAELCEAIRTAGKEENLVYAEDAVKHILKSLRSEYILPLQTLVERAFKQSDLEKFEQLSTKISEEAERIKKGIYEASIPRDFFIAYSSKDTNKVERLVEYLEANGRTCFVAARNLRHGRGAKQNYELELQKAIDACRFVIFVSSKNSRTFECDALKLELTEIKEKDILGAPPEYKYNYEKLPLKLKKPRIEYRIDAIPSQDFAEKFLAEFFKGLEYALSPEEVLARFYSYDQAISFDGGKEDSAHYAESNKKKTKYCANCGYESSADKKFCTECGKNIFVDSYDGYVALLKERLSEKEAPLTNDALRAKKRKKEQKPVDKATLKRRKSTFIIASFLIVAFFIYASINGYDPTTDILVVDILRGISIGGAIPFGIYMKKYTKSKCATLWGFTFFFLFFSIASPFEYDPTKESLTVEILRSIGMGCACPFGIFMKSYLKSKRSILWIFVFIFVVFAISSMVEKFVFGIA